MKPLTVLVADDEPLARENLRVLLERDANITRIVEASDGEEAVRLVLDTRPDLVFLDVQMPGLDGFGVVAQVGASAFPPVVFVTAYDQYAVKAFEVHAVDYLLKPFSDRRFAEALALAKGAATGPARDGSVERLEALLRQLGKDKGAEKPFQDRIIIRSGGDLFFLKAEDVYWIEAQGDYVKVHTREKGYLIRETMGRMEDALDPAVFVRVHRSTIVNVRHVKRLSPLAFGDYALWLENGQEIRVSRTFQAKLSHHLGA
jgi:two-component system, LytTR family, response regulator